MTSLAIPLSPLQEAWCELLKRYPLQWFCTLTFRDSVHPERGFKCYRAWINQLNIEIHGRRWNRRGQGVYWVLAWEWQKRGVLHFHALVGDVADLNTEARRLTWMDRWFKLAGIARISEIISHEAVQRYCSKYIAKEGQIDLSHTLRSYAQQNGLGIPSG